MTVLRGIVAVLAAAATTLFVSAAGSHPGVTRSQGWIAYSAEGMVWVANTDGSRPRALARGESPSWSPDGLEIAFQSARVPGNGLDIYLMDADGSRQRRLVMHPGGGGEFPINTADDYAPAWGPTGWVIAFTTKRDGNAEVYSMDPIGHRVQRLTSSAAADRDPAWSPDGNYIAFVSDRDGNDEIYSLSPRRVLRRLTHDAAADRAPAWSPDGRRIAFESFRNGNWELYSMNADGSDPRRLTQSSVAETNPSWSRDGDTIIFTTEDGTRRHLAAMPATGGPPRRLYEPNLSGDHADSRPAADLALEVRGPTAASRRRLVRMRLDVRNVLRAPAHFVVVTISLPPDAHVVSARVGTGTCSRSRPGRLRCSIRYIGPSSAASVQIAMRPRRCGSNPVRSWAESAQGDLTPVNNERRTTVRVRC